MLKAAACERRRKCEREKEEWQDGERKVAGDG